MSQTSVVSNVGWLFSMWKHPIMCIVIRNKCETGQKCYYINFLDCKWGGTTSKVIETEIIQWYLRRRLVQLSDWLFIVWTGRWWRIQRVKGRLNCLVWETCGFERSKEVKGRSGFPLGGGFLLPFLLIQKERMEFRCFKVYTIIIHFKSIVSP